MFGDLQKYFYLRKNIYILWISDVCRNFVKTTFIIWTTRRADFFLSLLCTNLQMDRIDSSYNALFKLKCHNNKVIRQLIETIKCVSHVIGGISSVLKRMGCF